MDCIYILFFFVVFTKNSQLPCRNNPLISYCVVFRTKVLLAWLKFLSKQTWRCSPRVQGEKRGKQLWLVVCLSNCIQRQFCLRWLVLPFRNKLYQTDSHLRLVWPCQANLDSKTERVEFSCQRLSWPHKTSFWPQLKNSYSNCDKISFKCLIGLNTKVLTIYIQKVKVLQFVH